MLTRRPERGRAGAAVDRYLPPPALAEQIFNLRVFTAVAETGSIARAATQLFRAASAVTRAVAELERALGATLFERQSRGLLLTTFGETALIRARRVEQEINDALADLLALPAQPASPSTSGLRSLLSSGRKLHLVAEIAALATMSAAAERLGISQGGASMALGRIETMLGSPLFDRRMEGMIATDAAARVTLHAARVFAELRHLASDLADVAGAVAGAVVVGTTPLGRTPVFTAGIAEVTARHPALRVVTVESNHPELVEGLRQGEIDLAVVVMRPDPLPGLTTERLFVDHLALLLRACHPLLANGARPDMAALLTQRWLLPRSTLLGRSVIEQCFRTMGVAPPSPSIETGDPQIIRQLLATTDMIAVTSPAQLRPELDAGLVVQLPFALPGAYREIGLVQREGAMPSPAATAVAAAIRAHAGRQGVAPEG